MLLLQQQFFSSFLISFPSSFPSSFHFFISSISLFFISFLHIILSIFLSLPYYNIILFYIISLSYFFLLFYELMNHPDELINLFYGTTNQSLMPTDFDDLYFMTSKFETTATFEIYEMFVDVFSWKEGSCRYLPMFLGVQIVIMKSKK